VAVWRPVSDTDCNHRYTQALHVATTGPECIDQKSLEGSEHFVPLSLPRSLLDAIHERAILDVVRSNAAQLPEPAASVLGTLCDVAALNIDSGSESVSVSECSSHADSVISPQPVIENFDNSPGIFAQNAEIMIGITRKTLQQESKSANFEEYDAKVSKAGNRATTASMAKSTDSAGVPEISPGVIELPLTLSNRPADATQIPSDASPLKGAINSFLGCCSLQNRSSEIRADYVRAHRHDIELEPEADSKVFSFTA
jgi:hypothetical protein